MDETLLELVNRLEKNAGKFADSSLETGEADRLRKALQKLEMLEQGARQILLNSL